MVKKYLIEYIKNIKIFFFGGGAAIVALQMLSSSRVDAVDLINFLNVAKCLRRKPF